MSFDKIIVFLKKIIIKMFRTFKDNGHHPLVKFHPEIYVINNKTWAKVPFDNGFFVPERYTLYAIRTDMGENHPYLYPNIYIVDEESLWRIRVTLDGKLLEINNLPPDGDSSFVPQILKEYKKWLKIKNSGHTNRYWARGAWKNINYRDYHYDRNWIILKEFPMARFVDNDIEIKDWYTVHGDPVIIDGHKCFLCDDSKICVGNEPVYFFVLVLHEGIDNSPENIEKINKMVRLELKLEEYEAKKNIK
jgi:hypothetical protein